MEDAVHAVHADGKALFCDAFVEEAVVEPLLGDVVAKAYVEGRVPERSKVPDVQDVC